MAMNKKLIIIIAAVLVVVIIGVVAFFLLSSKKEEKPEDIVYFEFPLAESYTNLKEGDKILKFEMSIQYTNEEFLKVLTLNQSMIQNAILEYFRSLPSERANQETIREDLIEILIEKLATDSETITNIYFSQFIIQG
jgi:flagellar basal body-associated protein FliL